MDVKAKVDEIVSKIKGNPNLMEDFKKDPEKYKKNMDWYKEQIAACTYRDFTTGFFYGRPGAESQIYDAATYKVGYVYLGMMTEKTQKKLSSLPQPLAAIKDRLICIEQKNKFSVGESIEIMKKDGTDVHAAVEGIYDEDGTPMPSAPHARQIVYVQLSETCGLFEILRRKA